MRVRVVCGRGVTIATFCPTRAFSSVDFPTFGRPMMTALPARCDTAARLPAALRTVQRIERFHGGRLLGDLLAPPLAPAAHLPTDRELHHELLGVVRALLRD